MRAAGKRRGEGQLGCIVAALVVAIGGLVAFKAVPAKVKSAEFYDFIIDQSEVSGTVPGEAIRKRILDKAEELDIPLDKKDLIVKKGADRIQVSYKYTLPLEFPGYTYNWVVEKEIDRPIFYF